MTETSTNKTAPYSMALCLSGGGFRATLFHLGVVRYLYEARLLPFVTQIFSVSGGSVLGAHLALNWHRYTGSPSEFEMCTYPLIDLCQANVRGRLLRRWLLAGWLPALNRTRQLRNVYRRLFGAANLESLSQSESPLLHVMATSLTTGKMCWFTPGTFSTLREDGTVERIDCDLPIATVVAASSAFPPLFPPVVLGPKDVVATAFPRVEHLADGGVYDNLGVAALSFSDLTGVRRIILSDASAAFGFDATAEFTDILSRTWRTTDILMERVASLEPSHADLPTSRLGIRAIVSGPNDNWMLPRSIQRVLCHVRTDLDSFSDDEVRALVWHGFEVAFHHFSTLSPDDLPVGSQAIRNLVVSETRESGVWDPCDKERTGSEVDYYTRTLRRLRAHAHARTVLTDLLANRKPANVATDGADIIALRNRWARTTLGVIDIRDPVFWLLLLVWSFYVVVGIGLTVALTRFVTAVVRQVL